MLVQTKVSTLLELPFFKGLTTSSSSRTFTYLCPGLCCFLSLPRPYAHSKMCSVLGSCLIGCCPPLNYLAVDINRWQLLLGFDWFSCCCLDELQQFFGHANTFRYTDHITLTVISCSVPFNNIHRIWQWSRTPAMMTAEESKEKAHLQHGSQKSQM